MPPGYLGEAALDRIRQRITSRLVAAGQAGLEAMKQATPVKTGFLKSSEGFEVRQSEQTVVLYADAPYAGYVEAKRHFLHAGLEAARASLQRGDMAIGSFPNTPGSGINF